MCRCSSIGFIGPILVAVGMKRVDEHANDVAQVKRLKTDEGNCQCV